MKVRLELQNSLLFQEVSKVVDTIPGYCLSQFDGPGPFDLQPMAGSTSEHLRCQVLEATPSHLGRLTLLFDEGNTRLVMGYGRPDELFFPCPEAGLGEFVSVGIIP